MHAGQGRLSETEETLEQGDGFLTIGTEKDQFLGGIAPPADRVLQVTHQFLGGFLQHVGLFPVRLMVLVADPPDAAHLNVLVDSGATGELSVSFIEPGRILNDAPVHVRDVEATVRPGCRC